MKVVTAMQMAAIDRETIDGGHVPSLELMERAGSGMARIIGERFPASAPPPAVAVCCGKGNNGGDGLVVARHLAERGCRVTVLLLAPPEALSPDARTNHDRLPEAVRVETAQPEQWAERWRRLSAEADLVVDAVFGTGIRTPVAAKYVPLLACFAGCEAPVVSLDIPSGVAGDDGAVDPVAVRADLTVTVQLPKLGLLVPPGRDHAGELAVVDIGFPAGIVDRHAGPWTTLLPGEAASLLPDRPGDTHKYRAGTLLVLAGHRDFGGAALLAGLGALRSGAGLVSVALPEQHAAAAVGRLPEALIRPLPTGPGGGVVPSAERLGALLAKQRAVAVGPGLGTDPDTDAWLLPWLEELDRPLVVDADGLSAFVRAGREPAFAAAEVVLTPHTGELARLAGIDAPELAARRLELVPELAARWGVVLVAKGAPTLVAAPDGRRYVNPTGNDALAHGGTGDVLTGLLGGLLAQGMSAWDAARLGCWLHGRAGSLAAERGSRRSVLAGEVAAALGEAWRELEWEARRRSAPGDGEAPA